MQPLTNTLSFDELAERFGYDFVNKGITTQTVAPGLHVLFGNGGNILASVGEQGVLLVDSQFPQMVPMIRADGTGSSAGATSTLQSTPTGTSTTLTAT